MATVDTNRSLAELLDKLREVNPDAYERACRAIRALLDGDRYVPCIVCGDEHGRRTWRKRAGEYDDGQCQHEAEMHSMRAALSIIGAAASTGLGLPVDADAER